MVKNLHVLLAFVTAGGFLLRAVWAFVDRDKLTQKWVRIAPHVIDTMLLVAGITLAVQLSYSLFSGWLAAKLLALLGYIVFGVLTLRGAGAVKVVGVVGSVASLGYLFAVAYSRSPVPFI